MSDAPRSVDALVERAGRHTAARTSRRGFLAGLGRVGLVLAGGSTLLPFLADPAHARVCGQSGTAPRCPTYDCDETWGWCWYASGCCANGALKKICDCCAPNTPHPRGYCPSGTRVHCITESCGHDPRLQTVDLERIRETQRVRASVAVARHRFRGRVPVAVLGDADDDRFAAVAASLGRVAGGPVLLTGREELDGAVADTLSELGVAHAVVGPRLSAEVEASLHQRGIRPERVDAEGDLAECAARAGVWSRGLTGTRRAVVILDDAPDDALGPAAAFAHARRLPLLFGDGEPTRTALAEPRDVTRTDVVTADGARARRFPGGEALTGADGPRTAVAIATAARAAGVSPARVAMAPAGDVGSQTAAALLATPLVLHDRSALGRATFDWLLDVRDRLAAVTVVGSDASLSDEARYQLQSVINEFEAHQLTGSAGEGLPVIPQPHDERPIGHIPYPP